MTQMEAAREGIITPAMKRVAEREGVDAETVRAGVAAGTIVIPANPAHGGLDPTGIGKGLRTKINANIGTSSHYPDPQAELAKLRVALAAGADTVMDLSTGGDLDLCRRLIIEASPAPVGTVPIYQAAVEALARHGSIVAMTADEMFEVIERQAADGVDFMTVHAGINRETAARFKKNPRLTNIVSRGGALLFAWMEMNDQENPFYEHYDQLLDICREYDVTISLGDACRPGSIKDATDASQIQELIILGELTKKAWEKDVQVMIEGPGHMALNEIVPNMLLEKKLCHGAPFYVLGPLVTDVAPGYDHITSAIGGAIAAANGADFLCYVTPAEHLRLPSLEDMKEGIIASRIAAHAADIAKGVRGAWEWDLEMAGARVLMDREAVVRLALDPAPVRRHLEKGAGETCRACGDKCAFLLAAAYFGESS